MKFRKKPVVIDAFQWNGEWADVIAWLDSMSDGPFVIPFGSVPPITKEGDQLVIKTPHGPTTANEGDWIIKDSDGDFYPCTDSVFKATYEQVDW